MIFALEYQLAHDTNEKDREIHKAALEKLKAAKKSPPKRWAFFYFKSKFPELRSLAERRFRLTKGRTYIPLRGMCVRHAAA